MKIFYIINLFFVFMLACVFPQFSFGKEEDKELVVTNCTEVNGKLVPPNSFVVPGFTIKCKEYYKNLPQFDQYPPFTVITDESINAEITAILNTSSQQLQECPEVTLEGFDPWKSNMCDISLRNQLKKILHRVAPSIEIDKMSVWKKMAEKDGDPKLILSYIIQQDKETPYTSFWIFTKDANAHYKATFLGTYLAGHIHTITSFGPPSNLGDTLFIKYQDCTECSPIIYLTALGFSSTNPKNYEAYQFSYDDNKTWGTSIEYALPGHGRSIDSEVTTRIPPKNKSDGIHLIQFFKMLKGGKDEWWLSSCQGFKCQSLILNELPEKYKEIWNEGKQL